MAYLEIYSRAMRINATLNEPGSRGSSQDLVFSVAAYRLLNATMTLMQRLGETIRIRHERQATVAALAALDDRTLRDIGVARHNLEEVAASTVHNQIERGHRPSTHLAA